MLFYPTLARTEQPDLELQPIALQNFPLGENTFAPARQLRPQELASCIDFKINPGGQLQSRYAFTVFTDTELGPISDIQACSLTNTAGTGTSTYTVLTDDEKAYYLVDTTSLATPTEIGPIEGSSKITAYSNAALICDGSYLKYADDVLDVKMAYDAGPDGTFFDNYSGEDDGGIALTTAGVGCTFTTPVWETDYTIPPTSVDFKVMATATSGASITATILLASDSSVVATKEYTTDDIPVTTADFLELPWASTDVTSELISNTAYYCLLQGANVELQYTTVTAGGTMVTAGGVTPDATKIPIMRLHPGLPPKADWAVVSNGIWVHDPDRPGGLWKGNDTFLDFSTTGYAGWIGAVDEDYNSYSIGKAEDLLGILYVYGTSTLPYISRLEGTSFSDYKLDPMFQNIWTTQNTLVNTVNDLWSASKDGVFSLQSTDKYRDLRNAPVSDSIFDQFDNWDSDTAIAGYNAKDGQYWLYMPDNGYINVCHVNQPIENQNKVIQYPWVRYNPEFIPTVFSKVGDDFLTGGADGLVYLYNRNAYKDITTAELTTTAILPSWKTAAIVVQQGDLSEYLVLGSSKTGSTFNIDFYVNGLEVESILTEARSFAMSDSITIDDLEGVTLDELATIPISSEDSPNSGELNINCWIIQVEFSQVTSLSSVVYFDGILLFYTNLGL